MVPADLHLLRFMRVSNVWLFEDNQANRFLIDSGDRTERLVLFAELAKLGIRHRGDLTAILLTHRHRDHAGNAAWLRRVFNVPVICHPDDADLLEGKTRPLRLSRKPIPLVHKAMCLFEDLRPAVSPVDETYSNGPWKWGFEVIPTPGHTEGTVMLYHRPSKTLFSGDSILVGIPPFRFFKKLSTAKAEYSIDVELCRQHVLRFLETKPVIRRLCPGHGPMLSKLLERRFLELL